MGHDAGRNVLAFYGVRAEPAVVERRLGWKTQGTPTGRLHRRELLSNGQGNDSVGEKRSIFTGTIRPNYQADVQILNSGGTVCLYRMRAAVCFPVGTVAPTVSKYMSGYSLVRWLCRFDGYSIRQASGTVGR